MVPSTDGVSGLFSLLQTRAGPAWLLGGLLQGTLRTLRKELLQVLARLLQEKIGAVFPSRLVRHGRRGCRGRWAGRRFALLPSLRSGRLLLLGSFDCAIGHHVANTLAIMALLGLRG